MNNRTDISNAKIVNPVGTGGDPSYAKVVANPTQPSGQLSVSNIPQSSHDVNSKKSFKFFFQIRSSKTGGTHPYRGVRPLKSGLAEKSI